MSNLLREHRLKANLSQKDLSKKSGVGRSTISEIESSIISSPTANTALHLAHALNSSVEEIFKRYTL